MIEVKNPTNSKPITYKTELEKEVYETLEKLNIAYTRVETSPAITMEDCLAIDKVLGVEVIKTLFLCNQQKTKFYLFVTKSNKKFNTKAFSSALNISRVSFGSEELLHELLKVVIGACTIFSCLIDKENKVDIIIDEDVIKDEYYGCSDGTTTCYMKLKTSDVLEKVLPFSNHKATIIKFDS